MFAFQFVNSYCGLLYIAFWLRDLERLRTMLMTMMMVKQFIGQLQEKYQPVVMRWIKDRKEKKNVRATDSSVNRETRVGRETSVHREIRRVQRRILCSMNWSFVGLPPLAERSRDKMSAVLWNGFHVNWVVICRLLRSVLGTRFSTQFWRWVSCHVAVHDRVEISRKL